MTNDADGLKRSLLLGARIRFSPSGATVRNQAIERIIEQNLASTEAAKGLTEQQLRNLVTIGGRTAVLRAADVKQGVDSLKRSNRLQVIKQGTERRYILSADAKREIAQVIREAEEHTTATIRELFGEDSASEEVYRRAFLRLLCLVFSKLGEVYVRIISMKQADKDFAEHQLLAAAFKDVLDSERVPDKGVFSYGVNRFFRESSPEFNRIKWNMAQNFYVVKALGIDSASELLSADMFKDASLYCDTNVLIAGLIPETYHHNSFRELANACEVIGMTLKVTCATVEELKRTINAHASLLKAVFDRIPDETQPKVRNFLLEAFLTEREKNPSLELDDFIERFQTPVQTLRDSFGLVEEDNQWFDSAPDDSKTKSLAQNLAKQYEEMRYRPKKKKVAIHDAMLLRWVARENAKSHKSWVVTLDFTLSEYNAQHTEEGFSVITLGALLQWMAPVVAGSADEDRLAGIFSDAIRYQLLPRDTFFQLRDFQVFAEMDIETRQLPSEDVEDCIREIKKIGPHFDPSKAEDREKIGQVIQRYFADPGTKYKGRIDTLSKELDAEKNLRIEAEKNIKQLELQAREYKKAERHKQLVFL